MTQSRSPRSHGRRPGARRPSPNGAARPEKAGPGPQEESLAPDETGALRIGPTDQGMVRFIIATHQGVIELDYPPEDAREIAAELQAAADIAEGG